ncbi:MAG: ABC transporter ATP-binding protein, partial [Oscillospiraceae bacterium]
LMLVLAFFSLIVGALSARYAAIASAGFAKNVRKAVFDKVQDFSFANVDKFSTASLVTRLTTDITNTQNSFMMMIRIMVRAPIMLVSATVMAVSINASLSTVYLFAIPVLALGIILLASRAFPLFNKMLMRFDGLNAIVQENLIAIRVVKAFVRKDYEDEKFKEAAEFVRDSQTKAEATLVFGMPMMQLIMYTCMIAVSWLGGKYIIGGTMMTGAFFSFVSYNTQILMSLMMVSAAFVMTVMSRSSIKRIVEVLDETLDIRDNEDALDLVVEDGSIEFDNVSFSYSKQHDNLTLSDVNLSIKSGETIGIIGGTGSAKTTLVQLIPRLYDVTSGSVRVGGHDVRDYKVATLRESVAMVLQKNVLFSGTIADNLRWGDEHADDEEIAAMCEIAQADSFVSSFPDGYETDLGQGGVNVSGGQKQRLCIARALLKKPKIIILDDSTSAVDTATDSKIRSGLKDGLHKTTTIIISQRVASVMDADRIIVLDEGKINAFGTHEELLAGNEIYREVYESQQKGVN